MEKVRTSKKHGEAEHLQRKRKKCLRKFLYYFPGGYQGKKYQEWERDYKWNAHLEWEKQLGKSGFRDLMDRGQYQEIAARAIRIESATNLLFSFEKMALRDAVRTPQAAKTFSTALYEMLYSRKNPVDRFEMFRDVLSRLPRKQTRVLTWPLQTVFGFIADPRSFIFLKPRVTQAAAKKYGVDFQYKSQPNWQTYKSLLDFAEQVRRDTAFLEPRDMIDLQSFIWVTGSEEYPD